MKATPMKELWHELVSCTDEWRGRWHPDRDVKDAIWAQQVHDAIVSLFPFLKAISLENLVESAPRELEHFDPRRIGDVAHRVRSLVVEALLVQSTEQYAEATDLQALRTSLHVPPSEAFVVNVVATNRQRVLETLARSRISCEPVDWCPEGQYVTSPDALSLQSHPLVREGEIFLKEIASMLPVHLFPEPKEGQYVSMADFCAAPGSKTLQASMRLANRGYIEAFDVSERRVGRVRKVVREYELGNVTTSVMDARRIGEAMPEAFDWILCDVPCSGQGTIRHQPEVVQWSDPKRIRNLSALQRDILASAVKALRPGGTLVYSTCTHTFEENEEQVSWLFRTFPGTFEIVDPRDTPAGQRAAGSSRWDLQTAMHDSLVVQHHIGAGSFPAVRIWSHRYENLPENFFAAVLKKVK